MKRIAPILILATFAANVFSAENHGMDETPARVTRAQRPIEARNDPTPASALLLLASKAFEPYACLEGPAKKELIDLVPGKNFLEKTASVQKILSGVEGDSLAKKLAVLQALGKIANPGTAAACAPSAMPATPPRNRSDLKAIYPLLEVLAGDDGVLNHRDTSSIVNTLPDGSLLRSILRRNRPRVQPVKRLAAGALDGLLDQLGVQASPESTPDGPNPRRLPPGTLLSLLSARKAAAVPAKEPAGGIHREDVEGLARVAGVIENQQVVFPDGIPVRKLKPLITEGLVPTDLKIRRNDAGQIEIR